MISTNLPSFFHFDAAEDLIRIGNQNDGGYLVCRKDVCSSSAVLSLGISDDWSFEEDFYRFNPSIIIHSYDGSVGRGFFLRKVVRRLIRLDKPHLFFDSLKTFISYSEFFRENRTHFEQHIGAETKSNCQSLDDAFSQIDLEAVFLKIDIEGAEYQLLNSVLLNEKKISGLVIEFHNVGDHLDQIEEFINKMPLKIVHIHGNNYAGVHPENKIPKVLEITFSRKSSEGEGHTLPHKLDRPNNPRKTEIAILIETP